MKFKFIPHTADIKFQAFGLSLEECFSNAGYALINVICKDKIKNKEKKIIKIKARDLERLLREFLEELLYLLDVGDFLVGKFEKVYIKGVGQGKKRNYELIAEVSGDNVKNYESEGDVKAVTYNDMWIKCPSKDGNSKFTCQVVIDV